MIKNFQKFLNLVHVVMDAVLTAAAYVLAYWVQFHLMGRPIDPLSPKEYLIALVFVVPGYLILYSVFGLYRPKRVMGRILEASNVISSNIAGVLIITLLLYLGKELNYSRYMIFYFALFNTTLIMSERVAVRLTLRYIRKNGKNQKDLLLIGYSHAAEGFIDRVNRNPYWGYRIRGILDDNRERGSEYKGVRVIGTIENLKEILEMTHMDEIIITLSLAEYSKLGFVVKYCEKSGVHTKFIPDYDNIIPTQPYTEDLLGLPVIHIRHVPLNQPFNAFIKRAMDVVGSIAALILFAPIMIVVAILIKISSPGKIFFLQERVGLHNRTFKMIKFRSMISEQGAKPGWTVPDDPRVTKIGKFIRKTSIDELPQLFNVLKGEMSLIGPRPEQPAYVEIFKEKIPRYMVKHQVRPGITGWAQVNGLRGDTSIPDRIDHDLYYIENWSVGLDLKIAVLTVFKGFINKNAY